MITYSVPAQGRKESSGTFNKILKEAQDHFEGQGYSILGEGWAEIAISQNLFDDYTDQLLKEAEADEAEQMKQLMDNARFSALNESLSGITPIASFTSPTIRKLWPKLAIKLAIPTEVVKLPAFGLTYMLPYIFKGDKKVYLPEGIMDSGDGSDWVEGQPLYKEWISIADFSIDGSTVNGAGKGFNLLANLPGGTIASTTLGDSIDAEFYVSGLKVSATSVGGVTADVEVPVFIASGLKGEISIPISGVYHPDDIVGGVVVDNAVASEDHLYGRLERTEGKIYLVSAKGKIKAVKVQGKLSTEWNTNAESVSFDTIDKNFKIGTGPHLNAPMPIEFLQDLQAMYNIDGTAKIIDIMTNVFSLKLDQEARNFIVKSHLTAPKYVTEFKVKPASGFSGSPIEWRDMLKETVDHLASKIKSENWFTGGRFVIIGNEMDIRLFPGAQWTFTGATSERSGVDADYIYGAVSGANTYTLIGSPQVPQGALYMIFISNVDEQMTLKYFAYTFNVIKGEYSDPQRSYVPNIMMTKRHLFYEFSKGLTSKIVITGNDGKFDW
jgi:hypothetical protein